MDPLRVDFINLVRDGPRATCEELIDLSVVDRTAASVDTSATSGAGSVPAGEAVSSKGVAHMALWNHSYSRQ